MAGGRANVVSSFTTIKGAFIPETYAALSAWDLDKSKRDNLTILKDTNSIGAKSETWLRDVAKVLNRRVDPSGKDLPLTLLAKAGCAIEVWKPILLWHITRDEFLLRDFLSGWLFPAYESGAYRLRPEEVLAYLLRIRKRGGHTEHAWKESTLKRVAGALLKLAVDFELLRGKFSKEFNAYHLPESSFLYLLHAMFEQHRSARKVIQSADWRMYLMAPDDVERELFRLHQYKKLEYQVAGSLAQLTLPCRSSREFAERLVA
jgi:hypothetical protein